MNITMCIYLSVHNARHFNFDKLKCPAYPNGIPVKYLDGSQVHDKKESDQKGEFVFLKESN